MKKVGLKVVLGIIIVLVLLIPIFLFVDSKQKETKYQELIEKVEEASRIWAKSHLVEENTVKVKLGELKQNFLIDFHLVNPKTKKHLANETYVMITKQVNGEYTLDLHLYEIPEQEKSADLIMQLNGEKKMQNGIGVRYQELGILVHEGEQEVPYSVQYFIKGKEVNLIDTSRPREYKVVYTALNSKGELANISREIVIQ